MSFIFKGKPLCEKLEATSVIFKPLDEIRADRKFDSVSIYSKLYKPFPTFVILVNEEEKTYFSYEHILSTIRKDYSIEPRQSICYKMSKDKNPYIAEQIYDLGNETLLHLVSCSNQKGLLMFKNDAFTDSKADKRVEKLAVSKLIVYYNVDKEAEIMKLIAKFKEVKLKSGRSIQIICKDEREFYSTSGDVREPRNSNLLLNYGANFISTHETITDWLNDESTQGLILLHGPPGTGKTSYLRFLISQSTKKEFMYMPPDIAAKISDPSFIPFLMRHQNSVLIIEDAENIIKDRQDPTASTQSVANLLNISDGLLGDSLHQKIIATFNCDLSKIDPALLRKGRLITHYNFDKLNVEDAQKLVNHLGIKTKITEPISIAEIYNL